MLRNKRILLIGPSNYNYPQEIKCEIERQGGIVHYYDERNNPRTFEKIALRKFHSLMKRKSEKYYQCIITTEKKFSPQIVLFISPEAVTENSIGQMKNNFPHAIFILYMWDSIKNKNVKNFYKLFDYRFSFDQSDCIKYSFRFRPLFFLRDYENDNELAVEQTYKYKFAFIGTAHSDRARIIDQLLDYCIDCGDTYYFYLYVQGRFMFVYNWLRDKHFRRLYKCGHVSTTTLPKDKVKEIILNSKCIIDINHPNQNGLTMRTVETLGLKRKLITTNQHIVEYDFYCTQNQNVINRENVKIDSEWIDSPYSSLDYDIYKKYKIGYWIDEVLDISDQLEE